MTSSNTTTASPNTGIEAKYEPTMITFYKTLVIGLGGTGREVCRLLKALLYSESHGNLKRYSHVKILAIDTIKGENTVDPQVFGLPYIELDPDEEMFLTVEQDIDVNKYPWFDEGQKSLLRNLKEDGTSARRQIGRLILLENWAAVYDKIRFKIGELQVAQYDSDFRIEWKDRIECKEDISIYVVGNLVGGTGSGMMLEIGYLINNIRDNYRVVNSSIAFTTMINKKYQDMGNRMINTVSALRELNHFYHEEIYGNLTTCFKIEAPTAPQKIPAKSLSRLTPPYDRIFLTDLDSFPNTTSEPEQAHFLISRFLYQLNDSHVGAHFRGKDVDDIGSTELDAEGNPLLCKSFGIMSVIDQKPTINRRCAFRLAERVIQCISGEDNITIERLQKEGLNVPPPKKEYVPQSLEDHTKNFAEELRKEMQETLAVQFEEIKNTMAEVPTGIGIKHEDYLEILIKKTYAAISKVKKKEFPLVLESSRNYLDRQFIEICKQIRRRAYMKKSKDVGWKSLFDIIWEKIENKMFNISNVIIPQEEDFPGSLHSVERFLYYLTYERDNLLTNQINIINKDKGQYKTSSDSRLGQFKNAETQMKSLYKQYFGKPALEQAIREFSVLARNYYRERLRHVIWERCLLILSGDPSESGEDERYQDGVLNLSKQLYQKYRNAYRKVCTIDNWFGQAYLNEHIKTGGVGMVSLPAKTDEKTIYEQLLKNSEKIIGLIKKVLDDYANGVPQELGNISDEKEKELHDDLFQWCLEYVNEITDRPSFDEIFTEEVDLKEDLKEHLNRALPMIKFDVNRLNETMINHRYPYCAVSIPPKASTLMNYVKNHDSFKTIDPIFLERGDTIYDVDLITASTPYNPSVSKRVLELYTVYRQERKNKDLHLFPEYSLLSLAAIDDTSQVCYDLAIAMGWLKIDMDERTLKYYCFYEGDFIDIDEGVQKEIEVYNWKNRTNPIYDQLWKSIVSKPRDPQSSYSVTVFKDILSRMRNEIVNDRENFVKDLREGVTKIINGEIKLFYKDIELGDETDLFIAFADIIARVIGKNPLDVEEWFMEKERETKVQAISCYNLGMAMEWLKMNEKENTLTYFYLYESEFGIELDEKLQKKEVEIYNWKETEKPVFDHLWKSIATRKKVLQSSGFENLPNDVINRVKREIKIDKNGFIQRLKKGVVKIIKGDIKLLYKKIELGQEGRLFKDFAKLISIATGKYPAEVEEELKGRKGPNLEELEEMARSLIANQKYWQARAKLEEIIEWAPERKQAIQNEFGFLYDFDNSVDNDKVRWNEKKELINHWNKLWYILSENNNFTLDVMEHKEVIQPVQEMEEELETPEKVVHKSSIDEKPVEKVDDSKKLPGDLGKQLEDAVVSLFHRFFIIAEDVEKTLLLSLRHQPKGDQFGHDISFECISKDNERVKCKIECKNMKTKITAAHILPKLAAVENSEEKIDHWILISARSNTNTSLNRLLTSWQEKDKFPFDIHIWSPENGIREFFGLEPKIYREFYGEQEINGIHPEQWPESKQREVYEKWKKKLSLKPLSRIPKEWRDYLREPIHMLLKEERERGKELELLYDNHVEMRCKDKTNVLLDGTMEDHVRQWLQDREKNTMFILGEFGDGKTFFTYILSLKLAREFLDYPINGWIPVRFSLNDYHNANNPQNFLERRLKEFDAKLASWNELRQEKKVFVILDGFDEMSLKLDSKSIGKSIKDLADIYKELKGMKLLITSRTHFFENKQDEKRLLQRLGKPPVFYLAPIHRWKVLEYLGKKDKTPERKELLRTLRKLHDPLELASKPLFLQMIETKLNKLQKEKITEETLNELNEIKLYNDNIDEILKNRKIDQWETDTEETIDREKTGLNTFKILEQLAIKLQESNLSYISLEEFSKDFSIKYRQKINKFIWEISGTDEEDAEARLQVRSLMARVVSAEDSCKRPVKFCHRSMREFFVARGIQRALKEDKKQALEFLTNLQLNHEILHFTAELMKNDALGNYEKNLVDIAKSSKISNIRGGPGGNAITLLYRLRGKLPESDWSGLNLDGAYLAGADLSNMKFSKTSMRYANLDNVSLEGSDFSECDLKGVRIEETAPVLAVTTEPMGNRIFAAYKDNTIREWKNILRQGEAESRIIFENTGGSVTWLDILHGSDLCAMTNEELIFYDCEDGEQLSLKSRFRRKPQYRQAIARMNILTLLAETEVKTSKALLVDLEEMEIANSLEFEKISLCENLDFQAFVITDGKSSLRIEGFKTVKKSEPLTLPAHDISSLCVYTCKKDEQYLLGCGQRDGEVLVWQIDYLNDKWQHKLLLKNKVHEGIVSSLCFLDDTRIVSGGEDRKILILMFDEDTEELQGTKEQELCLTIKCKGLKIEGVQGPREKEMLEKLIEKAG